MIRAFVAAAATAAAIAGVGIGAASVASADPAPFANCTLAAQAVGTTSRPTARTTNRGWTGTTTASAARRSSLYTARCCSHRCSTRLHFGESSPPTAT